MEQVIDAISRSDCAFTGDDDNRLKGTEWRKGDSSNDHGTMLLLHGGGQTRHSWQGTARVLAERGWRSFTLDQRGHGDSDWVEDGDYTFEAYAVISYAFANN